MRDTIYTYDTAVHTTPSLKGQFSFMKVVEHEAVICLLYIKGAFIMFNKVF